MWNGRAPEGIPLLEAAIAANPVAPTPHMNLGAAYYLARRDEDAARALRQALDLQPNPLVRVFSSAFLAAAEAQRGRDEEAQRAAEVVRQLSPFFDGATFIGQFPSLADRARIAEGLEKASLL
jgi:Flp pilus assembly protein TadD